MMKKILSLLLMLSLVLSCAVVFCGEASAASSFEFTVSDTPKHVTSLTVDALHEFYSVQSYASLLAPEQNEISVGTVTVGESSYENSIVSVRSFRLLDFVFSSADAMENEAQKFVADFHNLLGQEIRGTYLSSVLIAYSVKYEIRKDGEASALYIHVALASRQSLEEYNSLLSDVVRPLADSWKGKNLGDRILALGEYLVSSGFRLNGKQYSTAAFYREKSGSAADFSGFISLIFSELGYPNVILDGLRTNDSFSVFWVLLQDREHWYHYDYVSSTVFDANGAPVLTEKTYCLISTAKIQHTHTFLRGRFETYLAAANIDYNFSSAEVTPPIVASDKTALKQLIDDVNDLAKYSSKRYTADSYTNFETELEAAIQVYEDNKATEEEVGVALISLRNAFNGLVLLDLPDKSALERLLQETIDLSLYTDDSVFVYLQAKSYAENINSSDDISVEDVVAAENGLIEAKNSLVLKTEKSVLQSYIVKLDEMLVDSKYNALQKNTLASLRADLQAICDNPSASVDQIAQGMEQYQNTLSVLDTLGQSTAGPDEESTSSSIFQPVRKGTIDLKLILIIVACVFSFLAIVSILLYVFSPQLTEWLRRRKVKRNPLAADEPTIVLSSAEVEKELSRPLDGTQVFEAISDSEKESE